MEVHPALRQPVVWLTASALLGAGITGVYSMAREQRETKALEAERSQALAALSPAQGEIRQLSSRLDALSAEQHAARQTVPAPPSGRRPAVRRSQASRPREDP